MKFYYKTIAFLLQQQTGKFKKSTIERIQLPFKGKSITTDIYWPTSPPCGSLLFIHGMTLQGFEDPRQIHVCRSLAGVGFIVIAPDFTEIKKTIITAKSIDKIEGVVKACLQNSKLCPKKRLAIFAPSFSAALALRAAARESIREHISAIACVGTFAHVDTIIHFLLTEPKCDQYARLIILKNFLEYSIGKNPAVKKALEIKISDSWHKRTPAEEELPKFLKKMQPASRKLVEKLISDPKEAARHFKKFLPQIKTLSNAINPSLLAGDSLHCAVLLIHGEGDKVIPPSESQLLYEIYQKAGIECRLLFTPFISHGDSKVTVKQLPDLFKLIAAFAWFLRRV